MTNLKKWRIGQKLKIKEMAAMIGITDTYLWMLENGKKTNPSYGLLKAIETVTKGKVTASNIFDVVE